MRNQEIWILPSEVDGKIEENTASLSVEFTDDLQQGSACCQGHLSDFIAETDSDRDWVRTPAGIIIPIATNRDMTRTGWLVKPKNGDMFVCANAAPRFVADVFELPQLVHTCDSQLKLAKLWQSVSSDDCPDDVNQQVNAINRGLNQAIWRKAAERCQGGLLVVPPNVEQQRLVVAAFTVAEEFRELIS